MNKMRSTLFGFFILFAGVSFAQGDAFGISFSGFVKTDVMFDSRQTVTAREGHFLLFPAAEQLDAEGEDINAKANFNILALQTRLKGDITGPDAFGAKTSGRIEGAFFGVNNSDVNGFRLRHAFLKLDWDHSSLMLGQFWHPMFVTDCFPGTVSFNTGTPFQPFSRNPQIRYTYRADAIRVIAAALSQRDFTSTGPQGGGSMYLRNSAVPNLHVQAQYHSDGLVFGIGGDWKSLTPKLVTGANYKTTETVSSMAVLGFARFNFPNLTWKLESVYGQNMTDHLMLGGYGAESIDPVTGVESYVPTSLFSAWTDISTSGAMAVGLFAGMTQNLGADADLMSFYGRGGNIDMIYRVSPRIMWNSAKIRLAAELEYTAAAYGATQSDYTVEDAESVANLRLLLAAYYFF